jgi:hypothetical protein
LASFAVRKLTYMYFYDETLQPQQSDSSTNHGNQTQQQHTHVDVVSEHCYNFFSRVIRYIKGI